MNPISEKLGLQPDILEGATIVKMFGTGFRKVKPIEIEVLRDALGKPYVQLYGNAECLAKEQKITHVYVSITNTKEFSSAFVIGECRDEVCNK